MRSSCGLAGLYGPDRIVRRSTLEQNLPISGDPSKFLNLIHIDDAAAAACAALMTGRADPVYVAADDRPVTRHEYYTRMAPSWARPARASSRLHPAVSKRSATPPTSAVSNKRIKTELGLTLLYPDIMTGLAASINASLH